jgi:hypothetical protein
MAGDIEAEATIEVFCDDDGEQGAGCSDPPRSQRRNCKGEQGRCHQSAVIGQSCLSGAAAQPHDQRLAGNGKNGRHEQIENETWTEKPDMRDCRRNERCQYSAAST